VREKGISKLDGGRSTIDDYSPGCWPCCGQGRWVRSKKEWGVVRFRDGIM